MRIFLTILLSTIIYCLSSIPAYAFETALGVSPGILEYVAYPKTTITTQIQLFNNSNFPLPIKSRIDSFYSNEPIPEEERKRFDAASWVQLEPRDFILQPHTNQVIQVYLTATSQAEPGGHYATIIFEPLAPREALTPETTLSLARVGTLVMMLVPGETNSTIALNSWNLPHFLSFGPIEGSFVLNNNGNVHNIVAGSIKAFDLFGHEVFTQDILPSTILPQTSRPLAFRWDKQLLFGRYYFQANLKVSKDNSDSIIFNSPPIWVIPWLPLSIFLIPLTTITYLFIVGRKRIRKAWSALIE